MAKVEVERLLQKLVGELALMRAQYTLLTVFLDRLDGFSREQFEREFSGFWASQGDMLTQGYLEELERELSPGDSGTGRRSE